MKPWEIEIATRPKSCADELRYHVFKRKRMMKHILPPAYFFASIVAMVLLYFLAPIFSFAPFPWNLLGLIPLLTGIVLNLSADSSLKKAQTTVKPFEISTALITTGVFRISRHPMYFGMVLILFGIGMLMGSLTPLIVVIPFFALMEFVFIKTEEKVLEAHFGSEWTNYKNRVRKWV